MIQWYNARSRTARTDTTWSYPYCWPLTLIVDGWCWYCLLCDAKLIIVLIVIFALLIYIINTLTERSNDGWFALAFSTCCNRCDIFTWILIACYRVLFSIFVREGGRWTEPLFKQLFFTFYDMYRMSIVCAARNLARIGLFAVQLRINGYKKHFQLFPNTVAR